MVGEQRNSCMVGSSFRVQPLSLLVTSIFFAIAITTSECNAFFTHVPSTLLVCKATRNLVDTAMGMSSAHVSESATTTTTTTTEIETAATRRSKFSGIMAAESSSIPTTIRGYQPLLWQTSYDMNGNKQCSAILADDEVPPNNNNVDTPPPPLHNQRTLYYKQSLLSEDEASSLQTAAENSGNIIEWNQIAGIIENGIDIHPQLASMLHPILNDKILPWARDVVSIPTLTVADALIRSYDPSKECQHLTGHYDEAAVATVIVPLNDPNSYEGGLYVQTGASEDSRLHVPFSMAGDAVLHKYNVMHGVNVSRGNKRCSLVLWFGEDEESVQSKTVPWVIREAKQSVHAAFLFAYNSQHGLLGFDKDLAVAKEYYAWAAQRGHKQSEYNLYLITFKELEEEKAWEKANNIASEYGWR